MDEEVFVYSPDLSLLGGGSCTLVLTAGEVDVVRSALAQFGDRSSSAYERARRWDAIELSNEYAAQVQACNMVMEKLDKAEGRG